MTKPGRVLVAVGCLLVPLLTGVAAQAAPAAHAAPSAARAATPVHTLEVTGDGAASYPSYDPGIARYAVTTTDATAGTVTVTATTSDPLGRIWIDGRPEADGSATVTGLEEGDEVAVLIVDDGGTARHSLVYLPAGFPTLAAEESSAAPLTAGSILLGLTNFTDSSAFFQTALDRHGVPVYVERITNTVLGALDLKQQPDGGFSISRSTTTPGRTGQALVRLDGEFQPISSTETVGLVNTDGHDSIALPDGTVWLVAYEPNEETGLEDSIIQRIDPDGTVGFEWTSAPYAAESVTGGADYAHVNSIDLMADGSILASFRGFSSVFKIDTSTPTGSVVWKLGGVDSTFAVEDAAGAPDSGPCAQHTARELADGSILLFDNGAATAMCADPADPAGPRVTRTESRVLRIAVDEQSATAVVASSYAPGRFAQFAGSTQAVVGGGSLIGWSFSRAEVASEIDVDGNELWRLYDVNPVAAQRYFSYRAHLAVVPDVTDPEVAVESPAAGATYAFGEVVEASYGCTDRGGSSLQTCTGGLVDTSTAGAHTYEVTAADGAGNTTTTSRSYTVRGAASLPDAWVKVKGAGGKQIGGDVYGSASSQRATTRLTKVGRSRTIVVTLQNDGAAPDRLGFEVKGKKRGFRVRSSAGAGETNQLAPGEAWRLRIKVTRGRQAGPGKKLVLRVPVRSLADPSARDAVSVKVVARGRAS